MFFFNEAWRHDRDEHLILPTMDRIFLSGGSTNQGVGIAISTRTIKQISNVSFHVYSPFVFVGNPGATAPHFG